MNEKRKEDENRVDNELKVNEEEKKKKKTIFFDTNLVKDFKLHFCISETKRFLLLFPPPPLLPSLPPPLSSS